MNPLHTTRTIAGSLAVLLTLSAASVAFGQAGQPTLDDLLDLTPEETRQDTTEPTGPFDPDVPGDDPNPDGLNESVEQALSASEAVDAFEQAINEMDDVSRRLGRSLDPGIQTQRVQESILRKLDQVIEAAKNQSGGGGGGGSGQPREQDQGGQELAQQQSGSGGEPSQSNGDQASTGAAGSGTPIEPENQDTAIEQLRREWGVLPPRVREELSDGLRERFSPLYRSMTEAYYKALAEQE